MGRIGRIAGDPSLVSADLVDRIYASALEPARHGELRRLWQDHLALSLAGPGETGIGLDTTAFESLNRHFERAFFILEKLGTAEAPPSQAQAIVDRDPRPSLLVAANGRIVAVNAAACRLLDVAVDGEVDDLPFDVDGLRNIRLALARMNMHPSSRLLAVARLNAGERDLVLALSRAPDMRSGPQLALLTVANLTLSLRMGEILVQSFGLTETECDVARALVAGESASQIAASRNRAVETVRTQIKSVLRKINVHSRSELIRLSAALVQIDLQTG